MTEQHDESTVYAERMFPAPVDHDIAREDRADGHRRTPASTPPSWGRGRTSAGTRAAGASARRRCSASSIYPPTRGVETQGDPFEPVKIGILVDMDLGQLLADWIDPTILAIEDAMNEGVYDRPVEIITVDARGLPRENYLKVRKGYQWLVEQGCVVVLGPLISDNSVNLRDTVNATGVACIGWTGAVRFYGDYCFTVANGDIPAESTMCANWCFQEGHTKVGFFWEKGSSGTDYADYFRRAAEQRGPRDHQGGVARPEPAQPPGSSSRRCASRAPRRSSTRATATRRSTSPGPSRRSTGTRRASWAPRSCSIRTRTPGPRASRAGTASTSSARTARTPTTRPCSSGSRRASVASSRNVVVALAYDTARAGIHGIANALIATPDQVKDGLEMIKWMPCTNGGPGTYVTFAPYDHRGYKGDFLTIRELRGGELHFRGYYRPTWPSNAASPLLSP